MTRGQITGFILAGGRSRRMGRPKAEICWGGGTLLSSAVKQMKSVTSEVWIVGGTDAHKLSVPLLADTFPGRGPLAGIHAALAHSKTDWNLILAVDLPFVTADLLKHIMKHCEHGVIAVVPRAQGRLQPLCAAYHRVLLPEAEQSLINGELSIHRLLERLSTRIIEEDELIAGGFDPRMLLNVNTPEELERARAIAESMHE